MNTEPLSIDELANELCRTFSRSPFAFVSPPDNPEQRILAALDGRFKINVVHFSPDQLPAERRELVRALRAKRRVVCDLDYELRMPPELKASYAQDKRVAVRVGLDVPTALKEAFIAEVAADKEDDDDDK